MSTTSSVDPSNAEQRRNWDGDAGAFWATHADRFDQGIAAYHASFLAAAAIEQTSTVLDVGCGSGQTTRDAARCATAGSALGMDLSAQMIEVHPFPAHGFDLAISRHGAMFFDDPVAAFSNIARALRPGGRLVLLTWQPFERNEWLRAFFTALAAGRALPIPPSDAPSPFALSDPDRVRTLLTEAGFSDVRPQDLREPMYFGPDTEDAFQFVSGQHAGMVSDLDPTTRARALENLRANLADHYTDRGVLYDSAAWLIQARRR